MFPPTDQMLQVGVPHVTSLLPTCDPFPGMDATPWNVTLPVFGKPSQLLTQVPTYQLVQPMPHVPTFQPIHSIPQLPIIQPDQVTLQTT